MENVKLGGIVLKKGIFIERLQARCPEGIMGMSDALSTGGTTMMTIEETNKFLMACGVLTNKIEFENIFEHYGEEVDGVSMIDVAKFVSEVSMVPPGTEPRYFTAEPFSPNKTHLALSGVSHMEFGEQYKPFPSHWGVPPNCQMKGHDGVVRELPGGYGKGNGPMEKYVKDNMEHDARNGTDVYGRRPLPFGNYSLGSEKQPIF